LKTNRLLAGTLALVLIAGLSTLAFAAESDLGGEISNPADINFGAANEVQTIALPAVAVDLASNGDFETGDFTDWTLFNTDEGVSFPDVVLFDTDGDTFATDSAQFRVGHEDTDGLTGGGGISQVITTDGGTITVKADIAARDPNFAANAEGGIFTLFFDDVEVDSHAFGSIAGFSTERATLFAEIAGVSAGDHEVKIQMVRPFIEIEGATPNQFIDNVMILGEPPIVGGEIIPIETTSLILAGAQSFSWMIPVVLSVLGIGLFVVSRKSENS